MSKQDARLVTKDQLGKEVIADEKKVKTAKATKTRLTLTPPPAPPVKLGDVPNPILEKRGLKRALAVAIVKACTHTRDGVSKVDEARAALLIRASGILYKAGWKEDAHTDLLTQNEWAGRPYCRWAVNTPTGKVYPTKHEDKVKVCAPFAKMLKNVVDEEQQKTEMAKGTPVAAPAAVTVPA
jgi:hypothetical protein